MTALGRASRFLLGRLGAAIAVLFGVSVLIFLIARAMPGDPARLALGPAASALQVEAMRAEMGFDKPLLQQYLHFMGGLGRLDFGMSLYTNRPVLQDLTGSLPATLELVLAAGAVMTIFGLILGVASARHRHGWTDHLSRIFALLAVAMPNFVWAILFILAFAYWSDLMPSGGRLSDTMVPPPVVTGFMTIDTLLAGDLAGFIDALKHLVLPGIALSLPGLAQVARMTRTNMADAYAQPYIEFARAYGLSERSIAWRWAFRPAILPTLTLLGMQVAALLGNAFLVESVFQWPGMARYGVQAIMRKDLNAIVGVVMVVALAFVVVNLLLDALSALIDPRLRLRRPV